MNSLKIRTALTIAPLPTDGCVLMPVTLTTARSAEKVSLSMRPEPSLSSV